MAFPFFGPNSFEKEFSLKAMILAAGVGSRLDPITRTTPKPMVPVLNAPVMEHIVRLLVSHGFDDIIVNTHYLAQQIEDYFGDGSHVGAKITFNREAELLGTAGGLKRVQDLYSFFGDEPFLVIGGDDLTSIDLSKMLQFHHEKGAVATIGLTEVEDPSQFGVVVLDKNSGQIQKFVEKPKKEEAPSNLVNMGVYLFNPEILDHIPSGQFYDFGKQVFPEILEAGETFIGFESHEYWRDVGNLREYRDVQGDFFENLVELHVGAEKNEQGFYVGEGVEIAPGARVNEPCLIGAGSKIGAGATISAGSILGEDVEVGAGATVEKSIVWTGAKIGANTHVERCIIGFGARVESNQGIFDATIMPVGEGKVQSR